MACGATSRNWPKIQAMKYSPTAKTQLKALCKFAMAVWWPLTISVFRSLGIIAVLIPNFPNLAHNEYLVDITGISKLAQLHPAAIDLSSYELG